MKRLLIALTCLVGVVGVALAAPSTATSQDTQMKKLMEHFGTDKPKVSLLCGGG